MISLRSFITLVGGLGAWVGVAQAHDGHGLWGSHWHATDGLGFMAAAAVIGALAYWGRGSK